MKNKSLFCNLKQDYIAKQLGISQQTVSYWINGRCQPKIKFLPKLAEILKCSIEEVVFYFAE